MVVDLLAEFEGEGEEAGSLLSSCLLAHCMCLRFGDEWFLRMVKIV